MEQELKLHQAFLMRVTAISNSTASSVEKERWTRDAIAELNTALARLAQLSDR